MRILRKPQYIPDAATTKSRILKESARMFALSGYAAVSIRDIADATGIKSATIYAHFANKQAILDSIMDTSERDMHIFYEMLDRLSREADSFEKLLRNLFIEPDEYVNPFAFYALHCASNTQFTYPSSRRLYYDVYFQEGHRVMIRQLETAIERGLVAPFDTKRIASLITNCFLNMVNISVGRLNGFYQEFDTSEWYSRTIEHILEVTGQR